MADALQILVVDDEPNILQSCSRVLERAGHRVWAIDSARSALEMFQTRGFDLVVTDVMMPDVGGLEFIQQIKSLAPAATIIVITGYGTVETATEALRRGASGFLTKPFTPAELRGAVAEAHGKGQLARESIRTTAYAPLAAQIAEAAAPDHGRDLLALLVESTRGATGADAVILYDRTGGDLAPRIIDGAPRASAVAESAALRHWIRESVILGQDCFAWPGSGTGPASLARLALGGIGIRSLIACPIRPNGRPYGAIVACRLAEERPFTEADRALLRIQAHQARVYLEREELHQELNGAYLSVVLALSNALEARDAYTGGHCERLAVLGARLARQIGLTSPEIEAIRLGGILHDIGKIGVPDAVLLKAGALTNDERSVIERHTEIGYQIVEPIKGLRHVLPIIRHHHERFDGRGYPDSLGGEGIPIGARILGVCDAFEAMCSTRPYRPALPLDEALSRLRKGSGTQFDPDILDEFFRLHA